ncbi:MAG: 6-carboxytetrahydropterin synthase QueD [Endomicrobium sp.]|nr:6-carboxytetrahydropterin synthase QueD [Endomicrobium sp.]
MNYKVSVIDFFSAAHYLRKYNGKCENLHGHNWKIKVSFCGSNVNDIGMLIDFSVIKKYLNKILLIFDHKCINDFDPFDKINPTSENIAMFIFKKLKNLENDFVNVCEIEVWETDSSFVSISL